MTSTTTRSLGDVSYKASLTEEPHKGNIVVDSTTFPGKKTTTALQHDGIKWANAQEWIVKHFKNSGKVCAIRVTPLLPQQTPSTPRPVYRSYTTKDGFR
jgi:hypothetical protein